MRSAERPGKADQIIVALLEHGTLEKAAAALGVSDVTVWRWLQRPSLRLETLHRTPALLPRVEGWRKWGEGATGILGPIILIWSLMFQLHVEEARRIEFSGVWAIRKAASRASRKRVIYERIARRNPGNDDAQAQLARAHLAFDAAENARKALSIADPRRHIGRFAEVGREAHRIIAAEQTQTNPRAAVAALTSLIDGAFFYDSISPIVAADSVDRVDLLDSYRLRADLLSRVERGGIDVKDFG